jgi:hypothetical protein
VERKTAAERPFTRWSGPVSGSFAISGRGGALSLGGPGGGAVVSSSERPRLGWTGLAISSALWLHIALDASNHLAMHVLSLMNRTIFREGLKIMA